MNPVIHSQLSVRRRKGKLEDYLPIHEFMDSTKELCSDNRHRILHTIWGIKRIVIPIFGNTIVNSNGREINVKDLCEQDHILPDYSNKFIPTINDFISALNPIPDLKQKIQTTDYSNLSPEMKSLMLSPLAASGTINSLILTHNSWFINEIIPKIFKSEPEIIDFEISPKYLFDNMRFEAWMNNGLSYPESAKLTYGKTINKYDL